MSHSGPDYFKDVQTRRARIDGAVAPFARFAKMEAAGGIVLMLSALAAMVLANSPLGHAVHEFWTGTAITLNVGSWAFPSGKHAGHFEWWINDALMALFFFVIGLEIKREVLAGELKDPRKAALPLIAAAGGMAIPGLIYAALNWGSDAMRGWAIPTATDIAFALGVIALLGKRVPPGLRLFLVTLAIADDLGALVIIAVFYTESKNLSMPALGMAGALMGMMAGMNLLGVRRWWLYGIVGLGLWYFVLMSGVHATIAGVMGAMTIPVTTRISKAEFSRQARRLTDVFDRVPGALDEAAPPYQRNMIITDPVHQGVLATMEQLAEAAQTPLQRLERNLVPLVAFVVVPVFALANAGVAVGGVAAAAVRSTEAWGIVLGLVVGKTVGILGFSALAVALGISVLPANVTWRHILGAAMLGGIGFTMSLFIAHLGLKSSEQLEIAKLAVLCGSVTAAVLGTCVLLTCKPKPE